MTRIFVDNYVHKFITMPLGVSKRYANGLGIGVARPTRAKLRLRGSSIERPSSCSRFFFQPCDQIQSQTVPCFQKSTHTLINYSCCKIKC